MGLGGSLCMAEELLCTLYRVLTLCYLGYFVFYLKTQIAYYVVLKHHNRLIRLARPVCGEAGGVRGEQIVFRNRARKGLFMRRQGDPRNGKHGQPTASFFSHRW